MNSKGFSITKSLQYTLAMNFAVPCASLFMMYALDKFGRKITSVCTFVAAGSAWLSCSLMPRPHSS